MNVLLISGTAIIGHIFSLIAKKENFSLEIQESTTVKEKHDIIVVDQRFIDDRFNLLKQKCKKLGAISSKELPFDKANDFSIPRPFLPTKLEEIIKKEIELIKRELEIEEARQPKEIEKEELVVNKIKQIPKTQIMPKEEYKIEPVKEDFKEKKIIKEEVFDKNKIKIEKEKKTVCEPRKKFTNQEINDKLRNNDNDFLKKASIDKTVKKNIDFFDNEPIERDKNILIDEYIADISDIEAYADDDTVSVTKDEYMKTLADEVYSSVDKTEEEKNNILNEKNHQEKNIFKKEIDDDEGIIKINSISNGGVLDSAELEQINNILNDNHVNKEIVIRDDDWKDINDIIDDALDEVKEFEFELDNLKNEDSYNLILNNYKIEEIKPLLKKLNQEIIDKLSNNESVMLKISLKEENK